MTTKPQRYYKFVGDQGFSRLPRGTIDPEAYASMSPDLQHVVLHSGAWKPMTDAEIKKHKDDIAKAKKAAEDEKNQQQVEQGGEEVKS